MGKEAPEATDRSATASVWTAPPALMSSQPPQRRRGGAVGDHGADAGTSPLRRWCSDGPFGQRPMRPVVVVAGLYFVQLRVLLVVMASMSFLSWSSVLVQLDNAA